MEVTTNVVVVGTMLSEALNQTMQAHLHPTSNGNTGPGERSVRAYPSRLNITFIRDLRLHYVDRELCPV